jgi:hypothetical protein
MALCACGLRSEPMELRERVRVKAKVPIENVLTNEF